jgi:hypothetical protein
LDTAHTATQAIDELRYKGELELVDRYNAFATELLRLSLLGLATFGFLFSDGLKDEGVARLIGRDAQLTRSFVLGSVALFGISAVCALVYRYMLSETFRMHLEIVEVSLASPLDDEWIRSRLRQRRLLIRLCIVAKAGAVFALAVGASTTAIAIYRMVNAEIPQ